MKTAIVYFSLSGNTRLAAQELAKRLDADLIELTPEKAYPTGGLSKFLHGGKGALAGECPALKPYAFDAAQYDRVILGSPVWAGTVAPPLRTFVRDCGAALEGKTLAFYLCCSGGGGKAPEKFCQLLGIDKPAAQMILRDPAKGPEGELQKAVTSFCESLNRQTEGEQ